MDTVDAKAAAAAPTLAPGSTFHRFKVHSLLGQGAMGAAYLASHPLLRMPVVIKTFRPNPQRDPFDEAHLAARVLSPHVVPVLDAGTDNDAPFIVQRYVDGIDLEELIAHVVKSGSALPTELVCRILVDAAVGLHAIHQAGVVHRDVKPANLFLCGDGTTSVGDFGVATAPRKGNSIVGIAGTPQFMAPEQWREQPVDRRADLYALGATAHLLATGEPPFPGESVVELANAHLEKNYLPPTDSDPRRAFLFAVIRRMLLKSPIDRHPTAGAVARELALLVAPPPAVVHSGEDSATVGDVALSLRVGDLARASADVLVNAANTSLTMDLGVARALSEAGGPDIEYEARMHAPVPMGAVVWTAPGTLDAKRVAHAVAALDGAMCLQRCVLRVLLGAESRGLRSVLFPTLGTGVGGVPHELAAKLMLEAVRTFAATGPRNVREVGVMLFDPATLPVWREILASM